jgi:hypothetical protein
VAKTVQLRQNWHKCGKTGTNVAKLAQMWQNGTIVAKNGQRCQKWYNGGKTGTNVAKK